MEYDPIGTTDPTTLPRRAPRRRGDWRNADLRGRPEDRPRSVSGVVVASHRALRWARGAESILIALGSSAALAALASVSGARAGGSETLAVAALGGALAGLGWWLEHRRDRLAVARRLDLRLRHQGALVTAYELEFRGREPAPVEAWLLDSVLDRLRLREARRALLPSLVLPVAVPVGGALLLALALERAKAPAGPGRDWAEVTGGMVSAVAELGQGALAAGDEGRLTSQDVGQMLALRNRIRALDRRADRLTEDPRAVREIEALERDLAQAAARLAGEPDLRAGLEEARSWLDALRMGLGETALPGNTDTAASVTGGTGDGTMGGPSAGDRPTGPVGPPGARDPLPPEPSPSSPVAVPGVQRARWWPAEYDAIVQAYAALPVAGDPPPDLPPNDR